jgi:cysteine desulfurase
MLTFPIYLDNNATTPIDPAVLDAMMPYLTNRFGNAASKNHSFGWIAEEAVALARSQTAALIGANSSEIIFTSGATEAVNLAIKGVFEMYAHYGKHIITCATEHKAVLDTCKHIEKFGAEITILPVQRSGIVDISAIKAAIRQDTILITVMFANNETGVIQPIREIGAIAKEKNILFFTDAAQAVGKIPVHVIEDNIDLLSLSAHKIYAPKGAGALYVRRKNPRVKLSAQINGGGHEKGLRSGTLNVPGIVALGKAAELCLQQMQNEGVRIKKLRDTLEQTLCDTQTVSVNGDIVHRLPNVSNLSFNNTKENQLLAAITKTIAVSSGAACTSANAQPSHVLKEMGIADESIKNTIRFGLGRFTTAEEIDYTIEKILEIQHENHLKNNY